MSTLRLHPRFPSIVIGTQGPFPFALTYNPEDASRILRAVTRDERFSALEKVIRDTIGYLENTGHMSPAMRLDSALNIFRSA